MVLNGFYSADVPLRNYSLTYPTTVRSYSNSPSEKQNTDHARSQTALTTS